MLGVGNVAGDYDAGSMVRVCRTEGLNGGIVV